MISIQNLHKSYGRLKVLDGIDIGLNEGQVVALMGPNGSGKTTLLKSILGMVRPDKGSITFLGEKISSGWKYREKIGYMPQSAKFPDRITVKELFNMMKDIRSNGIHLDEEMGELYNLNELRGKKLGSLSGGTRQKVSAALAFLFDPAVLILDEPTTGLDPVSSEVLKGKIKKEKEKNKLIFLTTHIISDIEEVASHIMYLIDGKINFVRTIDEIKSETGEATLNKAIVHIMRKQESV